MRGQCLQKLRSLQGNVIHDHLADSVACISLELNHQAFVRIIGKGGNLLFRFCNPAVFICPNGQLVFINLTGDRYYVVTVPIHFNVSPGNRLLQFISSVLA